MNKPSNLQQWIDNIQSQHPDEIEMGLKRVSFVANRLSVSNRQSKTVLIAGTNGKGTTLAILEALAVVNKQKVFSYSSPHIFKFNERIRINGVAVEDECLIEAFEKIDLAREQIKLTFFEFTTLAAMLIEVDAKVDIAIYEVGLGGRLDAVNILAPDLSIITSIDFDHIDWLGNTLEQIATEKMAIGRSQVPMIIADDTLSDNLLEIARTNSQKCRYLGPDFQITERNNLFEFSTDNIELTVELPATVHPNNFAGACYAAYLLDLSLSENILKQTLKELYLPGRFQILQSDPYVVLDVSHNQQAICSLQQRITTLPTPVRVVCGMLKDKLLDDVLKPMKGHQYHWYLFSLDVPRGATAKEISVEITKERQSQFKNLELALNSALEDASGCGSIVIFGSFYTVEAAGKLLLDPKQILPQDTGGIS